MRKSTRGIETKDHLAGPRVTEFAADDLFHEHRIGPQPLENPLLLLEPGARGRELRRARRLILFQLRVLRLRLDEQRTRAEPESGQQHDVEKDDEATRVHGSVPAMNMIGAIG